MTSGRGTVEPIRFLSCLYLGVVESRSDEFALLIYFIFLVARAT